MDEQKEERGTFLRGNIGKTRARGLRLMAGRPEIQKEERNRAIIPLYILSSVAATPERHSSLD